MIWPEDEVVVVELSMRMSITTPLVPLVVAPELVGGAGGKSPELAPLVVVVVLTTETSPEDEPPPPKNPPKNPPPKPPPPPKPRPPP